MKLKLVADIARSLMLARLRQTLIATTGVVFSVTLFITLLGFMAGLNELLDGLILNRTPHIRLYNEIKSNEKQPITITEEYADYHNFIHSVRPTSARMNIHNSTAIINALRNDNIVEGVAPKISTQVFYNIGVVDIAGTVSGIDIDAENKLFTFNNYIVAGNALGLKQIPNTIILGVGAAKKMLVTIGDLIQVTTSKGDRLQLKVIGYFQSGIQELDNIQSYVSIETCQKLLGETNSYITDIQIKIKDIEKAPLLAKKYKNIYNVDAIDIQTANAQFETGSSVRTLISYAVGITLLIVSGFGIYNILNMIIYEKIDSIAILKATGFSGRDVKWIFLIVSISIGIVGAILGIVFGFLLSSFIAQIPFETEALPTTKTYPVSFNLNFYFIGASFAFLATYLAGFFPARKASRIDPVEILRGK